MQVFPGEATVILYNISCRNKESYYKEVHKNGQYLTCNASDTNLCFFFYYYNPSNELEDVRKSDQLDGKISIQPGEIG